MSSDVPSCRPIVLCGPSGVGKSTLISRLRAAHPGAYGFSVSHTTRSPRAGEEHGVHYHFSTKDDVLARVAANEFLEHAHVHGNVYGTSWAAVRAVASAEVPAQCLLDIDIQGVRAARSLPEPGLQALYIFIAPPSEEELERRLRGRGTEDEAAVAKRLAAAKGEIAGAAELPWDAYIINDDLESAYAKLEEVLAPSRELADLARAAAKAAASAT